MQPIAPIIALIEENIGLAIGSIGEDFLKKVVARQMSACGISSMENYFHLLQTSKRAISKLTEEITIPETWFFRNHKQLEYLSNHIKNNWLIKNKNRVLRILSLPCATGEEPYTIAMILFDAGLSHERFHIDAADISSNVLKKAKMALFDKMSFRGKDLGFRDRYFKKHSAGYRLLPDVQDKVTFMQGNIIDKRFLLNSPSYDIIFSRNLFIYLNTAAKKKAIHLFMRLLNHEGILFTGHSEGHQFEDSDLERIRQSGIYAYKKINAEKNTIERKPAKRAPGPLVAARQKKNEPEISLIQLKGPLLPVTPKKDKKQDKDNSKVLFDRARYLADQGQLEDALSICDEALNINNVFTDAYFLKGIIYGARDENDMADHCFNRVLYLDPGHLDALRHLHMLANQTGKHQKAKMIKERMNRIKNKIGVN